MKHRDDAPDHRAGEHSTGPEQELSDRLLRAEIICDRALLRERDESELLRLVCRALVEEAGFAMAWIGFARNDERRSIEPVARWGSGTDYLDAVFISWDDSAYGSGPSGTAIRTGEPVVMHDLSDTSFSPWRTSATERGFTSSASIPMTGADAPFGTLNVYGKLPGAFPPNVITVLSRIADSIGVIVAEIRLHQQTVRERNALEARARQAEAVSVEKDRVISALDRQLDEERTARTNDAPDERETYRVVFNASAAPMILVEKATGAIIEANRAAAEFYGYPLREMRGRSIFEFNLLDRPEIAERIKDARKAGKASIRFPHATRSGEVRQVETRTAIVLIGGREHYLSVLTDRTDEAAKDRQIAESELLLDCVFNATPGYALVIDRDRRIIRRNAAVARDFGDDEAVFVGTACTCGGNREHLCAYCLTDEAMAGKRAVTGRLDTPSATLKVHFQPFMGEAMDVRLILVTAFDEKSVTDTESRLEQLVCQRTAELRAAHQEVWEANRMLEAGQKVAGFGTFVYDAHTGRVRLSAGLALIYGLGEYAVELSRDDSRAILHPDDREKMIVWFSEVATHGSNCTVHRIVTAAGDTLTVRTWAEPIHDAGGNLAGISGASHDMTRFFEIEEVFSHNEHLLNAFLNASHEQVVICNRDATIIYVNSVAARMLGFPPERLVGMSLWSIIEHKRIAALKSGFIEALTSRQPVQLTDEHQGVSLDITCYPITGAENVVEQIGIFARDVTEIIRTRTALTNKLRFIDVLLESLPVGIMVVDSEGVIEQVNRFGCENFGYTDGELVGMNAIDLHAPEDQAYLMKRMREFAANPNMMSQREWRFARADGSFCDVVISARSILRDDGARGIVAVVVDISRMRELEAEHDSQRELLIQQSKMAAMGEMIGAIAHQWKQPLNGISIVAQLIQEYYSLGRLTEDDLVENVDAILRNIDFMSRTVDTFRSFFRPSKGRELFDPADAIQAMMALIEEQFRLRGVEMVFDEGGDGPLNVSGYPNEFKQVVLNILVNARDAIAGLPRQWGDTRVDRIEVRLRVEQGYCVIRIDDSAGGISPEIMDRIFEPYVTSKGESGTGIGLYMSRMIIERMNGTIDAMNTDLGARFTIRIPLA